MGESHHHRGMRSRDGSSRYSIDTLFPGLCNNSTESTSSQHPSSPSTMDIVVKIKMDPDGEVGEADGLEESILPSSRPAKRTKGIPHPPFDQVEKVQFFQGMSSPPTPPPPLDNNNLPSPKRKKNERTFSPDGRTDVGNDGPIRKGSSGVKSMWSDTGSGSSSSSTSSKRRMMTMTGPLDGGQSHSHPAPTTTTTIGLSKLSRKGMFAVFQPWVLGTYGDSAKTKTITKKKYNRIVKTLRGEEINNAENSKFRFWVKAKGFHIGPPSGHLYVKDEKGVLQNPVPNEPDLFVPTTVKDGCGLESPIFKRVAVVEYFFDIIYMVHVETEAKNGKHAGQKRTYRAITEKYAFLPREAVTKFLLQCTECQKRGSSGLDPVIITTASGSGSSEYDDGRGLKIFAVDRSPSPSSPRRKEEEGGSPSAHDINFPNRPSNGLPFAKTTTTSSYLRQRQAHQQEMKKQMRERREGFGEDEDVDEKLEIEEVENNRMVKMSHTTNRKKAVPSKVKVKVRAPSHRDDVDDDRQDLRVVKHGKGRSKNSTEGKDHLKGAATTAAEVSSAMDWLGGYQPLGLKKDGPTTNNNIYSNGKHEFREQSSPLPLSDRLSVNHDAVHDETSSNGNKDDEDDDDDESEDKMDTHQHDPERLKAFNMFVRLFVDENLDRMVPISKQPKEKIQAIIDSCTRQFPEFAERARKRIRTYLKSCRRNKRSRDGGWESARPTPAHLTSVQAEQILAQACENESQNAKRMRMGLEPVSQPLPLPLSDGGGGRGGGSKENGHTSSSSGGDSNSSHEKSNKVIASSSISNATTSNHIAATIAAVASNTIATSSSLSPSSSSSISVSVNDPSMSLTLHNGSSLLSNGDGLLGHSQQISSSSALTSGKGLERSPLMDYSRTLNGNGPGGTTSMSMYRPNFNQTFQRPSPFPQSLFPSSSSAVSSSPTTATGVIGALGNPATTFPIQNVSPLPLSNGDVGPTDLSMKSKPLNAQKLNSTELSTVRQLITGYRESAAFLLRSADELEQLLIQQQ